MAEGTIPRPKTYSPRSTANHVRGGAAAIRTRAAGVGERIGIYRSELLALFEWAALTGALLPFDFIEHFRHVGSGAEHRVYHDQTRKVAIKATHANQFGHSTYASNTRATPVEYLERLAWCNALFGDRFKIIGIARDEEEQVEIVCSQPWISAHPIRSVPLQTEINEYFGQFGFNRIPGAPDAPMFYHNDLELLVADAHDTNILRDEKGRLAAIDVVVGTPGPTVRRELQLGAARAV